MTEAALWRGIATLASARHLNEVGAAIEDHIRAEGEYGILTDYVGHGIGRTMHEEPPVFNYRVDRRGPAVKPGLVVAIEPMVVAGAVETFIRDDELDRHHRRRRGLRALGALRRGARGRPLGAHRRGRRSRRAGALRRRPRPDPARRVAATCRAAP